MHFNEDDKVTVCMVRNDCFDFQRGPRFYATIEHAPFDTGDLWHLRVDLVGGPVHIAINPTSADFIGMVLHCEPH